MLLSVSLCSSVMLLAALTTKMRHTVTLLRPPLLGLVLLLAVASSAHALPSRPSGLGGSTGGSTTTGQANAEQDWIPPPPSDMLISDMNRHNAAFDYHYSLWNRTDLNAETCRQIAEWLNGDTARARAHGKVRPCVQVYSCNFDSHRYPHWVVFTSCSVDTGHCENSPPGMDHRCFPHEEDILMLRYVEFTRSTRDTETEGNTDDSAAEDGGIADSREPKEKPVTQEKGEWQLWFFQVPSQCDCML